MLAGGVAGPRTKAIDKISVKLELLQADKAHWISDGEREVIDRWTDSERERECRLVLACGSILSLGASEHHRSPQSSPAAVNSH